MSIEFYQVNINVGAENDANNISRILKENKYNLLLSVEQVNTYRLRLNYIKLESIIFTFLSYDFILDKHNFIISAESLSILT